ncbi:BrnA antitoxin family protein [Desulfococcaceae bacterium HSG7]|nr:BrnA antitoxin family protein [Desulfococcaceae bacterium HSG9]MDM8554935.1 BrnA antitoxin family protein [Desulfococcaceae bacterium HSG7]
MKCKPNNVKQKDWDAVESPPLSDDLLKKMRPVRELHPDRPYRVRGHQELSAKTPISIRLSEDVIDYFQSEGRDWQTKINDILREYVKTHNVV